MAVDILYDNGRPPLSPSLAGENGAVLFSQSIDANSVTIIYEAGEAPEFQPAAGDVAIAYNQDDYSDFCVFYITNLVGGPTPPYGDFPITFTADYDPNVYTFRSTQNVVTIYSEELYSSSVANFANTYKVSANIEKAHYSDLMIAYSKTIKYVAIVDDLKRKFWGFAKDALYADTLFLIDSCQSPAKAYKVTVNSDTFEVFNNNFKKTIPFDIAV